jgi:hypothetical protein
MHYIIITSRFQSSIDTWSDIWKHSGGRQLPVQQWRSTADCTHFSTIIHFPSRAGIYTLHYALCTMHIALCPYNTLQLQLRYIAVTQLQLQLQTQTNTSHIYDTTSMCIYIYIYVYVHIYLICLYIADRRGKSYLCVEYQFSWIKH